MRGSRNIALCMPGNDLLSRRSSTIGAGAFHGRVRDGIGWGRSAIITRQTKSNDLVGFHIDQRALINESIQANRAISTG